jgi:hypothetical protein
VGHINLNFLQDFVYKLVGDRLWHTSF